MTDEIAFPFLEDVKQRVLTAVVNLYRDDKELLEMGVNERSITHKLAEHLQQEFTNWHVDCEYNRREGKIKKLLFDFGEVLEPDDIEARTVFPDIIVHIRGIHKNLLVIEVKKAGGIKATRDKEKLKAFGENPSYSYNFGLFLCLGPKGCAEAILYESGQNITPWTDDFQERLKEFGYC